jgi:phosphate-selective porin OprO/OprP
MRTAAIPARALLALVAACTPVLAAPAEDPVPTLEAIRRLEAAIAAQAAQLESQHQQLAVQRAELEALRAALAPQPAADARAIDELRREAQENRLARQDAPRWSFLAGRPAITSADGLASLAFRSVVQLDTAIYDQDPGGPLATDFRRGSVGVANNRETAAASDLSTGTNFRRARLGIEGTFARDFGYRFLGEFGGSGSESQTRINDLWVSYTGFAPFTIQLGAFSPPANMDDGTSVEDSLFIERSTPGELSRALGGADGRMGLGVRSSGTRWMGALTLTGGVASESEAFDEQLGLVGRLGTLALTTNDSNLHLGLSGTYIFRASDQGDAASGGPYTLRLRDRPEMRVDSTRLIDTGPIAADAAYATGIEFGANWRSFYLQAENFWYGIGRRHSPLADPDFGGYYVQGSWFLTGENRRYNVATGSFQNARPLVPFSLNGGPGAWELAWRYSHADLDDSEGAPGTPAAPDSVRGGEQDILSLGLNWTLNANLRLLFDYQKVDVERLNPASATSTPFGPAPATPPVGVEIGQDLDIWSVRTQFSF